MKRSSLTAAVIILSTFPDKKTLDKTAKRLVDDKIVACVNMMPASSVYRWQGKVQNEREYLAIFKTTQRKKATLQKRLAKEHPYDVPEILEIDVNSVNAPYGKWLLDSTTAIVDDKP